MDRSRTAGFKLQLTGQRQSRRLNLRKVFQHETTTLRLEMDRLFSKIVATIAGYLAAIQQKLEVGGIEFMPIELQVGVHASIRLAVDLAAMNRDVATTIEIAQRATHVRLQVQRPAHGAFEPAIVNRSAIGASCTLTVAFNADSSSKAI